MSKSVDSQTVLLFYREYQRDSIFPSDRYLKRLVRPAYNLIRRDRSISGFLVWFRLLARALRHQGYTTIVNDHRLALRYPEHPVGLAGYPNVLDGWDLPNPAILGPGLFDHPALAPHLFDDPRFRLYITTCSWNDAVFRRAYGDRCVPWHAGIDLDVWPDARGRTKAIDFLVYDKVRWERDYYGAALIQPVLDGLTARGLTFCVMSYGEYNYRSYRAALSSARAMVFLCEHETQGMAYQEAMASGVPILAWDQGYWLDPRRPQWDPYPVPATSVPYFSPECGERFRDASDFPQALDRFLANLDSYNPRGYVQRVLSLEASANLYMRHYISLLPDSSVASTERA